MNRLKSHISCISCIKRPCFSLCSEQGFVSHFFSFLCSVALVTPQLILFWWPAHLCVHQKELSSAPPWLNWMNVNSWVIIGGSVEHVLWGLTKNSLVWQLSKNNGSKCHPKEEVGGESLIQMFFITHQIPLQRKVTFTNNRSKNVEKRTKRNSSKSHSDHFCSVFKVFSLVF